MSGWLCGTVPLWCQVDCVVQYPLWCHVDCVVQYPSDVTLIVWYSSPSDVRLIVWYSTPLMSGWLCGTVPLWCHVDCVVQYPLWCQVDCVVQYPLWCQVDFVGKSIRERAVVEQYNGNGRRCPSDLVQTKPCYPKGCFHWDVSDWSSCMPQVSSRPRGECEDLQDIYLTFSDTCEKYVAYQFNEKQGLFEKLSESHLLEIVAVYSRPY